jgi:hypothetical protein
VQEPGYSESEVEMDATALKLEADVTALELEVDMAALKLETEMDVSPIGVSYLSFLSSGYTSDFPIIQYVDDTLLIMEACPR